MIGNSSMHSGLILRVGNNSLKNLLKISSNYLYTNNNSYNNTSNNNINNRNNSIYLSFRYFRDDGPNTGFNDNKSKNTSMYGYPGYTERQDRNNNRFDNNNGNKYGNSNGYNRNNRPNNYENNNYQNGNNQRNSSKFDKNSMAGGALSKKIWKEGELEPIIKNCYIEHPDVSKKTDLEIDEYLKENQLSICINNNNNMKRVKIKPISSFNEIIFPDNLNNLLKNEFKLPTPIQCIAWPVALSGKDLVGVAQTGSGKTLSFILPAIMHIQKQMLNQKPANFDPSPRALFLAPTRELAVQICNETKKYGKTSNIRSVAVYGGSGRYGQQNELRRGVDIVVATPGRLLDFLESGILSLNQTSFFVLDEADRMLDMGFEPQIRQIITQMRADRQTLMWSATWPREIRALAKDITGGSNIMGSSSPMGGNNIGSSSCSEHEQIMLTVGSTDLAANPNVEQKIIITQEMDKLNEFFDWLRENGTVTKKGNNMEHNENHIENSNDNNHKNNHTMDENRIFKKKQKMLIFCATKRGCDDLCRSLRYQQYAALSLHGDKSQMERDSILSDYRNNRIQLLVATDIAARGLDIKDIDIVINFDLPKATEDYIHRIGRTGRAGLMGRSITFISHDVRTTESQRVCKALIGLINKAGQVVPQELHQYLSGR